jgi:hypothetical protein
MIDPYIVAIDSSTLLKAKGYIWHKSSMKKDIVYHVLELILMHARWGFSHTKGWIFGYKLHLIFGYKLHLISSTGPIIVVPLAADFTTANVQDNQLYNPMTSSSSLFIETCFMIIFETIFRIIA